MINDETPTGDDSLAAQIRKLDVQADDTLVVELPETCDADDKAVVEYVRRAVREQTKQPDLGVLVVPHGTRLTILAKAATISDKLPEPPRVAFVSPDPSKLATLLDELDDKLDRIICGLENNTLEHSRGEMLGLRAKMVQALGELREGEKEQAGFFGGVKATWQPEVTGGYCGEGFSELVKEASEAIKDYCRNEASYSIPDAYMQAMTDDPPVEPDQTVTWKEFL